MQELSCTWVPGTLDLVRLKLGGNQKEGKESIELTSTHLARVFGSSALNDLYLRGRAILKADPKQVSQLR